MPVTFSGSTTTQQVTLTVKRASLAVVGQVVHVSGNSTAPFPAQQVQVRIQDTSGRGNSGYTDAAGNFSIRVPAGTYGIKIFPYDTSYAPPAGLDKVQLVVPSSGSSPVQANGTSGPFVFTQKNASIICQVVDPRGNGVAGVAIHAWQQGADNYADTFANGTGNFALPVVAGKWYFAPSPSADSGYVYADPPVLLDVKPSAPTACPSANGNPTIAVTSADSTLDGQVLDGSGNLLAVRGVAVAVGKEGVTRGFVQAPIQDGRFTLKVPHGTYLVSATFPPGSGYTAGAPQTVTVTTAGPNAVSITATSENATISGSFLLNGTTAMPTPQAGSVFGTTSGDGHETARLKADDSYTMSVSPGAWFLRGYFDDPSTGYVVVNGPDNKVTATANQTATLNFKVVQADATIGGVVSKPDGTAMGGARVWAMDVGRVGRDAYQTQSVNADQAGAYSLKLPPGTYRVNAAAGDGYIPPAPQLVSLADNDAKTVNLQFRALDATIAGTVTLNGAPQANAFVRAFPTGGGAGRSATTDANGKYTLRVVGGTAWTVQALAEVRNADGSISGCKSDKASVTPTSGDTTTQDLTLALAGAIPAPVVITFDSTQDQTIVLSDGTKVVVPAGAMDTSGDVTLRVTPKSEVVETFEHRALNLAYELVALDASDQPIPRFNSPVSIVLTYDPATLPAGVNVADLLPQYWDPISGSWKEAENVVVDTTAHTIAISVSHFTDYAVTAQQTWAYQQYVPVGTRNTAGP